MVDMGLLLPDRLQQVIAKARSICACCYNHYTQNTLADLVAVMISGEVCKSQSIALSFPGIQVVL